MTIHYEDSRVTLHHGDCLDVLRSMPDSSVDAVVTDPPYGLEFMGKDWDAPWKASMRDRGKLPGSHATNPTPRPKDYAVAGLPFQRWCEEWAVECLRVLKPGGHLLAFGGTRTWHRLACAVEDAGFEIRDGIAWLYGSGFPKSLDVSKAIDKAAGAEREVTGYRETMGYPDGGTAVERNRQGTTTIGMGAAPGGAPITAPATDAAREWVGWGTAMKPAHEPVVHGVKPLDDRAYLAEIGSHLGALEQACRQRASAAASSSAPSPADSPEAKTATAPASAATQPEGAPVSETATGEAGGSSGQTGTSQSESTAPIASSTVSSWRAYWAEISEATSTSTTSTATSRTTDLRTLSSCLSSITQSATGTSTLAPDSWKSLVTAADNLFAAGVLSSRSTLALSAIESATSATQQDSQGAAGTSPAFEPVVVARKPLTGTVAGNVLEWGTGALNIDGCRIGTPEDLRRPFGTPSAHVGQLRNLPPGELNPGSPLGRWPANVVLDEAMADALDEQSGTTKDGVAVRRNGVKAGMYGPDLKPGSTDLGYGGEGGASRFFYVAKAPKRERPVVDGVAHPTVKPLTLMRWLVRLVTPPGGTVLEPFAGSGTTVEACIVEGVKCVAIEKGDEYLPLIVERIQRQDRARIADEVTRRPDPEKAIVEQVVELGLFDLDDEGAAS